MDLDPIKQLQSLLDDRGKVLEKISSIHSALGSLRANASAASDAELAPASAASPQAAPIPLSDDHLHGRLVQALHEMQWQIEERVRPLALQVTTLEAARLKEQSANDQAALRECLAQIDQCILACVDRIAEYQKKHAVLAKLNQRLETLGSAPEPLPQFQPRSEFDQTINLRLEEMRQNGKL